MNNFQTRIIPYVIYLNCKEILYTKEIGLTTKTESYIQFKIKTLKIICFSYRRDGEETFQENFEEILIKDYIMTHQ